MKTKNEKKEDMLKEEKLKNTNTNSNNNENREIKKNKVNYYKYSTIFLFLILVIFGFFSIFSNLLDKEYLSGVEFGQRNAVNIILKEVSQNGFIEIPIENNLSITLIDRQRAVTEKELFFDQMIEEIKKNGAVQLTTSKNNILLTEYLME